VKKRTYRTVKINDLDHAALTSAVEGRRLIVGIDVAKVDMVAALADRDAEIVDGQIEVLKTITWRHPAETPLFVELVASLPAASVELAMEPTGTYGDALRFQLQSRGLAVFRVSSKKVHDGAEVYDGVPSSHDAKASAIIAKLQLDRLGKPWPIESDELRELKAALRVMAYRDMQVQEVVNHLEALLTRHWPEATELMELTSVTLLTLLEAYGSPAAIASRSAEAGRLIRKICRGKLGAGKAEAVLDSAARTVGQSMTNEEVVAVKVLAEEGLRSSRASAQATKRVEQLSQTMPAVALPTTCPIAATAAVVVSAVGEPQKFSCAKAYEKAAGLNVKIRQSGKYSGRLKLTKRGSGVARRYLYLAVLRLIQHDPVVRAWYLRKVERDGGRLKMKALAAVMRKLICALWHVGQGERFDSSKLFDVARLGMTVAA
jgi:transposase